MNNFEKIKAMNIDEMAEFFIKHKLSCRSVMRNNTAPCPVLFDICTPEKCYKQWLESEVRE